MINLQQKTMRPDDNRLRIVANLIINCLWKNMLVDYAKIQQLRELAETNPAKALKAAAKELAGIIRNNVVAENVKVNNYGKAN